MFFAVEEEGEPDADFVEDVHGDGEEAEGKGVGGGGDDGGGDDDGENGVGAGGPHHFVGENAEFDEGHDDDGEFEGEAEDEDELSGKGDVVANAPVVLDAHFEGVLVEEVEDGWEDDEIGKKDPT